MDEYICPNCGKILKRDEKERIARCPSASCKYKTDFSTLPELTITIDKLIKSE